jgi:choline dehydrogenase-like flavoprotein
LRGRPPEPRLLADKPDADVLVIGAGAAGAVVSARLSESGVRLVCLEQGDWVRPETIPSGSPGWEARRQTTHHPSPNVRRLPADYPINESASDLKPLLYNAVGGSTIHWGGHFPRLRPSDFRVRTLDGVADDWPLDYEELAPYYDRNDERVGVSGVAGDPGNPPRSQRPMPPVPLGRGGELLAAAFDRLGWHWWPPDLGINTRPDGAGRQACNNCGPCDLGCPTGARSSSDLAYWPRALRDGAVLRTHARVCEITVDGRGRATGALYFDADGNLRRQRANVVVMACNAIGTPRLLLLSRSERFPDGLANSSGLVGKNLMLHPVAMVTGLFDEPLDGYKGPFAISLVCQEFYETDGARGFVRGYQMQLCRGSGPLGTALGSPYPPRITWGADHHRTFLEHFGHGASLAVTAEDLPDERNRVMLDPTLVDAHGIPAPAIHYRVGENTAAMIEHGIGRATDAFTEAGAKRILATGLIDSAFHILGTARMGSDPSRSVSDRFGRSHDVRNLFIADSSLFVTCGAANPASTVQALALRTAEHILRLRRTIDAPA